MKERMLTVQGKEEFFVFESHRNVTSVVFVCDGELRDINRALLTAIAMSDNGASGLGGTGLDGCCGS
jgi:glycine cleavage system H lipoate-binding protein